MIKRILLCLLSLWTLKAFSEIKYGVNITTILQPPYTAFLSDYVSPESKRLMVNLTLNDYNNPVEVFLRITISGGNIVIQNRPDFRPLSPITLNPRITQTVSGEDLYEYFDYNNLVCSGISKDELLKNGRLPEGYYSFCIEVWDYNQYSSVPLNKFCSYANIRLYDPPSVVAPANGSVIKATATQNIVFQWQNQSITPDNTRYELALYEIIDSKADAATALNNGQAVQVFRTDELLITTYNYDVTHPALEKGKKYAFWIIAYSSDNKESFRNKGKSQIGWFYYGYPEKGHIAIKSPSNDKNYTTSEDRYFEWGAADNLTSNQPVKYNVKIVKSEKQDDDAMTSVPFYEFNTTERQTKNGASFVLSQELEKQEKYIWQIKAYSEDQEIAKSDINSFYGPPVLDEFYAGNHKIKVTRTLNKDKSNLSGKGLVSLSSDGKVYEINFEHLNIINTAGIDVLQSGEIAQKVNSIPPVDLKPNYTDNGKACFKIDSIKINRYGLNVRGIFEWELPFTVNSSEKATAKSKFVWIPFNNFIVTGRTSFATGNNFELLDPLGFKIELSDSSVVIILNNEFSFQLTGKIVLPAKIRGNKGKVSLQFNNAEHLFYMVNYYDSDNLICPINSTGIFLLPQSFIIDLSEEKSPLTLVKNPEWKGAYFTSFRSGINVNFDASQQLKLPEVFYSDYVDQNDGSAFFYADDNGLTLNFKQEYSSDNNSWFNGFPSALKKVKIKIDENSVTNSFFKGSIKIPFFSETKNFNYTVPVSDDGLHTGWFDESLEKYSFDFNPDGGEQKMNITINRAVFEGNMLDMNVSILWPSLSLELKNIEGFRIWSDNKIGFGNPNTTVVLTDQENGVYKGYPLIANSIGAGMKPGIYAIGINATVGMSSDIAGGDGPPKTNLYSVDTNKLLGEFQFHVTNVVAPDSSMSGGSNIKKESSNKFLSNVKENPSSFNIDEVIEGAKHKFSIDEAGLALKTKKIQQDFKIKPPTDVNIKDTSSFKGSYKNNITGDALKNDTTGKSFKIKSKKIELPKSSKKEAVQGSQGPTTKRFQISDAQRNEILRRSNIEISKIIGPVTSKVDSTITKIRNQVNEQHTSINQSIKNFIGTQIDTLEERFIRSAKNYNIDISKEVHRIGDSLTVGISSVLTSRIDSAADLINSVLNFNVTEAVSKEFSKEITVLCENIVEDGFKNDYKFNIDQLKNNIVNDLVDSGLVASLPGKAERLISSFDFGKLSNELWDRAQEVLSEVLAEIAKEKLHEIIDGYTKPINDAIDNYAGKFTTKINEYRDEVKNSVDPVIIDISNTIYDNASAGVGDPDLQMLIKEACDSLQTKLTRTFDNSTDNLALTLNNKIIKSFADTVKLAINLRLYSIADQLLDNGLRAKIDVQQLFTDACNQVGKTFTLAYICNTISEAGTSFIQSIDPAPLISEVIDEATKNLGKLAEKKAIEKIEEGVETFVTQLGGEENPIVIDLPLDLDNIDEKIKNGDFAGMIKLDDINISLNTSFLKLNGKLSYKNDDKIFGNVWKANLAATVNIVNEFSITIDYVTGHKDNNAYWFCQVRPGDTPDDNIAQKKPQALSNPIYLGPVKLVGAGGYIMHHVKVIDSKTIAPDNSIEYGSYMNLVFFDASQDGKVLRIEVAGENTTANGNTKSKYEGNMQIVSINPKVEAGDESAAIKGEVLITYDRKEQHFVGLGTVVIDKSPTLCASGAIGVETSPGKWKIAIGDSIRRIIVQPGCSGWTPTGWLIIDQNTANLGIGVQYNVKGGVSFDIGIVALSIYAKAGFAYGGDITIQYFPYFALNELGVWADAWALVYGNYRLGICPFCSSGSFELCDIYARASLKMIFNPPPTVVRGTLSGYVRICGVVSTDFNAGFSTTL